MVFRMSRFLLSFKFSRIQAPDLISNNVSWPFLYINITFPETALQALILNPRDNTKKQKTSWGATVITEWIKILNLRCFGRLKKFSSLSVHKISCARLSFVRKILMKRKDCYSENVRAIDIQRPGHNKANYLVKTVYQNFSTICQELND